VRKTNDSSRVRSLRFFMPRLRPSHTLVAKIATESPITSRFIQNS
jgi:hypothetical protein